MVKTEVNADVPSILGAPGWGGKDPGTKQAAPPHPGLLKKPWGPGRGPGSTEAGPPGDGAERESNRIPAEQAEPRSTTWESRLGLRPGAGEGDGARGGPAGGEAQGNRPPALPSARFPPHHLPTCWTRGSGSHPTAQRAVAAGSLQTPPRVGGFQGLAVTAKEENQSENRPQKSPHSRGKLGLLRSLAKDERGGLRWPLAPENAGSRLVTPDV